MTAPASDPAGPRASALLAGILASPADDLPRLVYADALEATGEPADADRATLIRDEIRTGEYRNGCVGKPSDGLPCPWCGAGFKFLFRRGFLFRVDCTLAGWLRGGPRLVREHPVERVVTEREPAEDRSIGPVRYLWFRRPHRWEGGIIDPTDSAWDVPPLLWPFMRDKGPGMSAYTTREAALAELSAALIAWANAQPTPSVFAGPPDGANYAARYTDLRDFAGPRAAAG